MKHENQNTIKKSVQFAASMIVTGMLLACTAGCHSLDDPSSSTIPKATVQSKAQAASEVQNNPNIPPEAKAHIAAQIQGTAPPPTTGAAKP